MAIGFAIALLLAGPVLSRECGGTNLDPAVAPNTPLTVTFHGVSTLMFDDGRDRVLVDGFFSRPESPVSVRSDGPTVRGALGVGGPPLRAVLAAHAHHDHALDLAMVAAEAPEAVIVGTPSVATLMQREGVKARVCAPADRSVFVFGAFKVTVFHVEHGPPLPVIGWILDRPLKPRGGRPSWIGGFTDDRNLSFLIEHGDRRILVHPSAGTRDLSAFGADTVFLGAGRLSALGDREAALYLAGTVGPDARLVVPIHWDRFTTPLGEPLQPTPWPFDDIERGFQLICGIAPAHPSTDFLRMDAGARLQLQPGDSFAVEAGSVWPLCPPEFDQWSPVAAPPAR